MNSANDNWGSIKVVIAWASGYLGTVLGFAHTILGDMVLFATLVFTVLQIAVLMRKLRSPPALKPTDFGDLK